MRILHVTNTYLPVRNGVTVAVAGWTKALRAAGHEVAVWTVACGPARTEDDVFAVKGAGSVAHGFPLPLSLAPPRELAAREWDVVHVHHPVLLGPAAVRFARHGCAVLAGTAHSDYVAYLDSYTPLVANVARRAAQLQMSRFFDRMGVVFAPSEGIEHALRSWGVSAPIKRTSYPIDVSAFEPRPRSQARAELGIAENRPLALYAGRLAVDKHVLALLQEFEVTLRRVPEALLAVVGGGPMSEQVHREAARLDKSVIMTGPLDAPRLGAWYCAADAFVSASPNEVGPLATLEAGLLGTPTVALAVPGFVDRVTSGVNGRLAADVPGELGEALADVLTDRETASRMGEAARVAFAKHTPARSAELLVAAYRGAVDACSSRRKTAHGRPRLKTDVE